MTRIFFGLIFTLLMFWQGNQGQGKTCVIFIHEIQVLKSKNYKNICIWLPLAVKGYRNDTNYFGFDFHAAHVIEH